MANRLGEKAGWIGGWSGGFLWVLLLSVMWLAQGRFIEGVAGLLLVALAGLLIIATAPWRHPKVPYWKLMSPIYLLLVISCAWAIWAFGGKKDLGELLLSTWFLLLLFPLGVVGRRRWSDSEAQQVSPLDADRLRR